jgi:hypothetical protein
MRQFFGPSDGFVIHRALRKVEFRKSIGPGTVPDGRGDECRGEFPRKDSPLMVRRTHRKRTP